MVSTWFWNKSKSARRAASMEASPAVGFWVEMFMGTATDEVAVFIELFIVYFTFSNIT